MKKIALLRIEPGLTLGSLDLLLQLVNTKPPSKRIGQINVGKISKKNTINARRSKDKMSLITDKLPRALSLRTSTNLLIQGRSNPKSFKETISRGLTTN